MVPSLEECRSIGGFSLFRLFERQVNLLPKAPHDCPGMIKTPELLGYDCVCLIAEITIKAYVQWGPSSTIALPLALSSVAPGDLSCASVACTLITANVKIIRRTFATIDAQAAVWMSEARLKSRLSRRLMALVGMNRIVGHVLNSLNQGPRTIGLPPRGDVPDDHVVVAGI